MIKTLIAADRSERERFKIPRSVQQSIPIQRIYREANSAALGALRILTTRWPPMTINGICSLPTAAH